MPNLECPDCGSTDHPACSDGTGSPPRKDYGSTDHPRYDGKDIPPKK